jgi:small subunit ribosomal protein S19e
MATTASHPARTGATLKDVPAQQFISALAAHLKKSGKLELPAWHDLVKTSVSRELAPVDPDWYYVRAASLLRRVYLRGGIGVGAFSKVYGANNRKVESRPHFQKAARKLIRHILQQLETEELLGKKKEEKGRFITSKGRRELDTLAGQVLSAKSS